MLCGISTFVSDNLLDFVLVVKKNVFWRMYFVLVIKKKESLI